MSISKEALHRKSRVGVYLDCSEEDGQLHQETLDLMLALTECRDANDDPYGIYVYSSKKVWKKFCKEHGWIYRPFPTSGASNRLGKMLFGSHVDSPKPPEWVGEMLNRKAADFKVDVMIFATPTTLVKQSNLPSIVVMRDIAQLVSNSGNAEKYGSDWYSDLYSTVVEHATVALVDVDAESSVIDAALAESQAKIEKLSFGQTPKALGYDLSMLLRSIR